MRQRLALALMIGVGVATASAQSPPAKAAGPAPGQAKGTLIVNAKPVVLRYAYAALEPNASDQSKDDIVIVLTDTPVADDLFASKSVASAARAAGVRNSLLFVFHEDKQHAFAFLGEWIVTKRTIAHEALKGRTLQSSPDIDSKVEPVSVGRDRVEATVSTETPQEAFGDTFEFHVVFNAVVKPRAK